MTYRPEIDGLRTVSVVAVLLYHYGFPMSGGFTGVDVFFVISGYVITKALINEITTNRFSVLGFYDRRVRRILPALVTVIIATFAAGIYILGPNELASVGRSAAYAVFGLSNFYFLWHTGYFETASSLMPLLHTWSLGVEEQFYVAWPLVLAILFKFFSKKNIVILVFIFILASFSLSEYYSRIDPSFAFYVPQTRAWQLGIGALAAFTPAIKGRPVAELTNLLGLLLIVLGFIFLSASAPFPGWRALLPTVGAGLVVLPKSNTFVSSVLSNSFMVFVGKISYSLYLWHWPILVMYRHANGGEMPDFAIAALLMGVSFVLSVLSYYFVERPFRVRSFNKKVVVIAGAITAGFVATLGYAAPAYVKMNETSEIMRLSDYVNYRNYPGFDAINRRGSCLLSAMTQSLARLDPECVEIDPERKNYLLLGDSHAAHLWIGLKTEFPEINFLQATISGCRPIYDGEGSQRCRQFVRHFYDQIADSSLSVDGVILAGRWTKGDIPHVADSLKRLNGAKVMVIGPIVEYQAKLPILLAAELLDESNVDISGKLRFPRIAILDKSLKDVVRRDAKYVSLVDILCKDVCTKILDGVPVQYDYGHLTLNGSLFVAQRLKQLNYF